MLGRCDQDDFFFVAIHAPLCFDSSFERTVGVEVEHTHKAFS